MCNLTTAKEVLVNTNEGLEDKINQALAQIANMQKEIKTLKQQRRGGTGTITMHTYYCCSHRYPNSLYHNSLNC